LRPSKPAHPGTESGRSRPSWLTRSTRKACPHRADAHGACGTVSLLWGRQRPRCTGETTPSTSTSSHTRRAPTRQRGAREVTGRREQLWAHRRRGRFRHTTASRSFGSMEKRPVRWDVAANGGDWKMARGARLSPVKGVGADRADARWRLRAPFGAPAQGRRVRGLRGCCGRGESKREATDGGAHRRGALGGIER
jgi:hypothetical protein